MNIKKTKISWFFFAVYVITYLYLGVCIGNTMSGMLDLGGAALSCIVVVMVILLAFVGCAAALIVLMKARPKDVRAAARRKRRTVRNDSFFTKELLPALASYLLVVISRGVYIWQFSAGKLTGNVGLYERVSSGAGVEFDMFNGVERLYAYLLKGFCILLGNVPDAVYILNLICQVILVFCCYLFLRVAAGRAAAIASSVLFLGIPYFYHMIIACEPVQLFMALFAAAIAMLAFAVKRSIFDFGGKGMFPAYLFCGLFAGMLMMLDMTALLIPLAVIVIFLSSVQGRRAELICFAAGVLFGIPIGMILLNIDVSGTLFSVKASSYTLTARAMHDFDSYISLYEPALSLPTLFLPMPEDLVLLCVIAFGGIAAVLFFWCEHDVLRIIGIPYFGMILLAQFNTGYVMGVDTGFLSACVGVLTAAVTVGVIYLMGQPVSEAGADSVQRKRSARRKNADVDDEEADENNKKEDGVTGIAVSASKNKKDQERPARERRTGRKAAAVKEKKAEKASKKAKKENAGAEKQADAKEAIDVKEKADAIEQAAAKEKPVTEEKKIGEKAETTAPVEAKSVPQASDAGDIPQPKKPRLIENPLPLPKKREHREMDYAYEISADRMHYDVEVRDEDDFDC